MKSKELQEMEAEALEQEPSLDKMVDLNNPQVLEGLGRLVERRRREGHIPPRQTAPKASGGK
jgi:hypothetical protein